MIERRTMWLRAQWLNRVAIVALAGAVGFNSIACDGLLDTTDPSVVTPEQLQGPEGVPTAVAGMIGDFQFIYDDAATASGILIDELVLSGTGALAIDGRFPEVGDGYSGNVFRWYQTSLKSARDLKTSFESSVDDPAFASVRSRMIEGIALANFYEGFSLVLQAEHFCGSILEPGGAPVPSDQAMQKAIELFNAAQQSAGQAGRTDITTASQVGKARARLWLKDYPGAASLGQSVPTGFVYFSYYSANDARQYNRVFAELWGVGFFRRFTVGDGTTAKHGNEKYAYYDEWVSQGLINPTPGIPAMDPDVPLKLQLLYDNREADMVLASGWEARMIEAEAAWRAGDHDGAELLVNALLTDPGQTLNPMKKVNANLKFGPFKPVDFTGNAQADLPELGRARAAGLWLTGERLGTLRRFLKDGLDLYPVKPGGGKATCFPFPLDEILNNPNVPGPYPAF